MPDIRSAHNVLEGKCTSHPNYGAPLHGTHHLDAVESRSLIYKHYSLVEISFIDLKSYSLAIRCN